MLMPPRADLTLLRCHVSSRPWLASATATNVRTPIAAPGQYTRIWSVPSFSQVPESQAKGVPGQWSAQPIAGDGPQSRH